MILVQLVPLERGFTPVRVPWVEKGDDYQIVRECHHLSESLLSLRRCSPFIVIGDENNFSDYFTISIPR